MRKEHRGLRGPEAEGEDGGHEILSLPRGAESARFTIGFHSAERAEEFLPIIAIPNPPHFLELSVILLSLH